MHGGIYCDLTDAAIGTVLAGLGDLPELNSCDLAWHKVKLIWVIAILDLFDKGNYNVITFIGGAFYTHGRSI
jgi:uncharacterized protein YpmB